MMRFLHYGAVASVVLVVTGCRTPSEPSDSTPEMPAPSTGESAMLLEDLSSYPIYAPGNWWARDIRDAPVDPDSDAILQFIGGEPAPP